MKRVEARVAAIFVVVALAVTGKLLMSSSDDYEVKLVMESAAQLVEGSPVLIDGARVGDVDDLTVQDGKAVVSISIARENAPLHEGTTTRVEWNSVLGERVVTVIPASTELAPIREGSLVEANASQIELDQVLAALDAPTREQLKSLITELSATVDGSEEDLRSTLKSAGPSVEALGEIMAAVGKDGPAIRSFVTELQELTRVVAARQGEVRASVSDLTSLTDGIAAQQDALSEGLAELPSTLRTARRTLDQVPSASRTTSELLLELRPATKRLPGVAADLRPVMRSLRPAVTDLKPVLAAATRLLAFTPGLLETSDDVLPEVEDAIVGYTPAVKSLRPWTPEAAGWLTNWGQAFAPYDSQGHVWSAFLSFGLTQFNDSVVMPPTVSRHEDDEPPTPGQAGDEASTDAYGSTIR